MYRYGLFYCVCQWEMSHWHLIYYLCRANPSQNTSKLELGLRDDIVPVLAQVGNSYYYSRSDLLNAGKIKSDLSLCELYYVHMWRWRCTRINLECWWFFYSILIMIVADSPGIKDKRHASNIFKRLVPFPPLLISQSPLDGTQLQ